MLLLLLIHWVSLHFLFRLADLNTDAGQINDLPCPSKFFSCVVMSYAEKKSWIYIYITWFSLLFKSGPCFFPMVG